jgi:hypothetical protein
MNKWFSCSTEAAFEKNESLTWTFAEKAPRKGWSLRWGIMRMWMLGVGGVKDLHAALKWYTWVSVPRSYGIFLCIYKPWSTATQTCRNTHAVLPCTEYDSMTHNKLVRKHPGATMI